MITKIHSSNKWFSAIFHFTSTWKTLFSRDKVWRSSKWLCFAVFLKNDLWNLYIRVSLSCGRVIPKLLDHLSEWVVFPNKWDITSKSGGELFLRLFWWLQIVMAPPQPKAAVKPAAAPAGGVAKPKKVGKPRNYDLGNGVVRFSKSKMFHKKVSSSAVPSISYQLVNKAALVLILF